MKFKKRETRCINSTCWLGRIGAKIVNRMNIAAEYCEWNENKCNWWSCPRKNKPVLHFLFLSLSSGTNQNSDNIISKMYKHKQFAFYLTEYSHRELFVVPDVLFSWTNFKMRCKKEWENRFNIDASGRMEFVFITNAIMTKCCVFSFEFTSIVRFTDIKAENLWANQNETDSNFQMILSEQNEAPMKSNSK